MAQLGFYYDMKRCAGCRVCQIACNDVNDLQAGTLYRKVVTYEGGSFPKPWAYHLSMSCNHCEDPKCVKNCPTRSLYKREDGIVGKDQDLCIGCGYCLMSCPYGAPKKLENGKTGKCTMCSSLIDEGGNPACVDACMNRALDFGDLEELKAKYGGTDKLSVLVSPAITKPSIVVKAKSEAR